MCLQINMVKYNANWEITNIYMDLQIVWSQFCTDKLLFIYIQSSLNIYLLISIWVCCQRIQMNGYSVTFGYSQNLVQHLMNDPEGRKTTICHYLQLTLRITKFCTKCRCAECRYAKLIVESAMSMTVSLTKYIIMNSA